MYVDSTRQQSVCLALNKCCGLSNQSRFVFGATQKRQCTLIHVVDKFAGVPSNTLNPLLVQPIRYLRV